MMETKLRKSYPSQHPCNHNKIDAKYMIEKKESIRENSACRSAKINWWKLELKITSYFNGREPISPTLVRFSKELNRPHAKGLEHEINHTLWLYQFVWLEVHANMHKSTVNRGCS